MKNINLLRYLHKYRRTILGLMIVIIVSGSLSIIVSRFKKHEGIISETASFYQKLNAADSLFNKPGSSLNDIYMILNMESELHEIMEKDNLTMSDSLFIQNLNQKLNQMINE